MVQCPPLPHPPSQQTPRLLNRRSRIFLKLENLQPSGSFKSRGIGHYLATHIKKNGSRDATTHFYCSSGGNAGLACVVAARQLGFLATIVVPMTTKPLMLEKLREAGAKEVIQVGANWKEADTYLRGTLLEKDKGGVYVPPFDHPDICEGHSSLMHELKQQLADMHNSSSLLNGSSNKAPDAIICSVGGGGLFNGIMQGLEQIGWSSTQVVALETVGADSLSAALKAGELVTLPGITSIATSLGATRVAEQTFRLAQCPNARSFVLSDAEAVMGCWRLADDERLLVEPACGVNAALCYNGKLAEALGRPVNSDMKVVVVVCGGSNVTLQQLALWRAEYAQ
jgi:L-serine/L-threonine ammonia-lyase